MKPSLIAALAVGFAAIASANVQAELIGRYDFDTPDDPLVDSSGKGNHLTIAGGTNPVWGAATGFGGTGAYDYTGDRLLAPINVNPAVMPQMSWGAWVRTRSLSSGLRKVLGHDDGAWDRTLGLDNRSPDGSFRYTAFTGDDAINGSGPVEGTPAPTSASAWTFLAASHNLSTKTITVYVDLDASTTADALISVTEPAAFGTGFSTFAIGGIRPDNNSEAWDGVIDQVFLYDEALDLAAVTALRNTGAEVTVPVIISFGAMPGFIDSGQWTTLSWSSAGAESVSINWGAPAITGNAGSVAVSPTQTTTYTLTATNGAGSVTAQTTVGVDVEILDPVITEFMASNSGTLDDGDGSASDWIEIFNPNPFAISLAGYALRGGAETWVFPDEEISAGAYLIVFASGQPSDDYVDGGGFLHTNFKLSASGEVLQLVDTDGSSVLFEFTALPAQQTDASWGIDPATGDQGFMVPPTPGGGNGPALGGFVADTKFDVGRGFFSAPVTVTISTATPGASISYTIDGSEPSASHGTVVAAPLTPVTITTTTVLRAMAFRIGWVPTNVDTNTYLFLGDVIDQPAAPVGFPTTWGRFTGANGSNAGAPIPGDYEMKPVIVNEDRASMIAALESLPTMSIVADPNDLFSDEGILTNPFATVNNTGVFTQNPFVADRACSVEWFQPDGVRETQVDCGVRLTGGWSRHYSATPKKSLRLTFKNEFGPTQWSFPLFGEGEISEFDKVQLRATFSDAWVDNAVPAQYLRDPFVRETYLAMGGAGARGTFVHLYLNGLYWGIYNPGERPDADYGASHFGGSRSDYDALKHQGLTGPGGAATNSYEVIDGTATRWQEALALSNGNMANPAVYAQFRGYVDVVSLADYIILNSFLSNSDWPGKNWYAFGRRDGTDGGFKFSPWDSEYSLLDLNGNRVNVSGANTPAQFYDRARSNPEFRLLFADRIHRHAFNGGPLTASAMIARYSAMAASIESAVSAEAARWGDNPNTRQGNRDYRKSHWISGRNAVLNNFLPNRPPIAIAQYRAANLYPSVDAPEFSQHGGLLAPPNVITFSNPSAGTVYFTTDGSDPRLEGGAANPIAGSLTGGGVTTEFFGFQSTGWRYFVTASGLGDSNVTDGTPPHASYGTGNWKHPDFVDAPWPSGRALLGYGGISNLIVNQEIGYGGDVFNRYLTTYFRKEFQVTGATNVSKLLLNVIRDDGALLYVNGREVGRTNMPAGTQTYSSVASADANPEDEIIALTYDVPPGLLREGRNVLAVELHQRSANSSDLGLDVALKGVIGNSGILLSQSGTVKARLLSPSNEWSALTEAFFTVAATPASAANLTVSKIHYRPAAPSQAEINGGFASRSDFEYLELLNVGPDTLSLAGVTISEAINFSFAPNIAAELDPGERAVLVSSSAAFRTRYGMAPRVLGQFASGNLSDDGEEIVGTNASGGELWRFTYNDAGAWPDSPDGGGPALVLSDPDNPPNSAGLGLPENWRPSATVGGSPGSDDRTFLSSWLASLPNSDPLADPNHDGINQLLAFATGALNATDARAYLPTLTLETLSVAGINNPYAIVSVRHLTGAAGFSATVKESAELTVWQSGSVVLLSNTDLGDGTHILRYRSALPSSPSQQQFYQLSVTRSP